MNRLPFVLWMVGFHLVMKLGNYIDFRFGVTERIPIEIQGIYYLITWGVWIWVGILLWRDGNNRMTKKEDGQ